MQSGGEGDVRYSTPQNKEPEGGREGTRPLIYLFAPLLFQALEKKAKKECKRERKVIMSQRPGTKRRIGWRI